MAVKVKFKKIHPGFILPTKATAGSSGYDFSYCGNSTVILHPRSILDPLVNFLRNLAGLEPLTNRATVSLGCKIELPKGYELQIRPRSGLAHKNGIGIVNSPGTIDSDYTGEMKAILINHGDEPFEVLPGMRVCQGVFSKTDSVELEIVQEELAPSIRAEGGFGSTGV